MRICSSLIFGAVFGALAMPTLAQGDADAGKKVFNKCKACHMVGEGAKNRVGPELNGVVGRPIATAPDFKYSKAFMDKAADGHAWTEEELAAYLADPKGYIPGNKMAFVGLKKDEDIANVIAYLKTFPAE